MKQFEYPTGATPLYPEEIEGLKLKHITTRSELDRWEQENIQEALAWLSKRRKTEVLNEKFIRQLHEKMFNKVWKWAGNFRRTNKNIGVEWAEIPIELKQLLDDAKYWIENNVYSQDETAYRFHHRLVWVHLFPNGNGRHARMMADVLLMDVLGQDSFTWGNGNLVSAGETRKQYIDALKAADLHDYSFLQGFVRT
jgi:Fic-DOC domain mobile mystery protein B